MPLDLSHDPVTYVFCNDVHQCQFSLKSLMVDVNVSLSRKFQVIFNLIMY